EAPAHPGRLDRLPHHLDVARRLERVVGAEAAGHLDDPLHRVVTALHQLGGALAAGQLQPLVGEVDADDALGAGQPAAGDSAAPSSGASGLTLARAISGMTVYSANVLVPMKWRIGSPSRLSRAVPSGRKPLPCMSRILRQRLVRGLRQWMHSPHCGENRVTT